MELEANKVAAEEFKQQGNSEFKNKNYAKAIELYTKAISKQNIIEGLFSHLLFLQKNLINHFLKKKNKLIFFQNKHKIILKLFSKLKDNNESEPNYYGNRAACYLGLKK